MFVWTPCLLIRCLMLTNFVNVVYHLHFLVTEYLFLTTTCYKNLFMFEKIIFLNMFVYTHVSFIFTVLKV